MLERAAPSWESRRLRDVNQGDHFFLFPCLAFSRVVLPPDLPPVDDRLSTQGGPLSGIPKANGVHTAGYMMSPDASRNKVSFRETSFFDFGSLVRVVALTRFARYPWFGMKTVVEFIVWLDAGSDGGRPASGGAGGDSKGEKREMRED